MTREARTAGREMPPNHESVISQHALRRYLQRSDLHPAPLDGPSGVLKPKRPFGELAVPDVDSDDPVKNDGQFRSPGLDLEGVPLAAGFIDDGDRYLGDIDNGPRAITGVGARVPDVYLIGIGGGNLAGVAAADEDAAVGI